MDWIHGTGARGWRYRVRAIKEMNRCKKQSADVTDDDISGGRPDAA